MMNERILWIKIDNPSLASSASFFRMIIIKWHTIYREGEKIEKENSTTKTVLNTRIDSIFITRIHHESFSAK